MSAHITDRQITREDSIHYCLTEKNDLSQMLFNMMNQPLADKDNPWISFVSALILVYKRKNIIPEIEAPLYEAVKCLIISMEEMAEQYADLMDWK